METQNPIPRQYITESAAPLYTAPNLAQIIETSNAVGDVVGETRPATSSSPAAKQPSGEDFEMISIVDTSPTDDDCNKCPDIDWLCTKDPKEIGYMTLIPYSISPVEPRKLCNRPSRTELQRVGQLRSTARGLRRDIQNLKSLLEAKDEQFFYENEEDFKRLREFVAEPHKHPRFHNPGLELASRLFFASRYNRDECGPLNDEINSLEEKLESEEIKLRQAEDSLYESFGLSPMESDGGQETGTAKPERPISRSQATSKSEHNSTNHVNNAESQDGSSEDDMYSSGSFEKYRKNYHPLYIEYLEQQGTQENSYERRAYFMEDQARLEEQQKNRHRFGLTLLKEDQDFLDGLPETLRLLNIEIDECNIKIEHLRAQCLEQGIIDENDNYIDKDGEDSDASDDSHDSYDSRPSSPPPPPPLPASAPLREPAPTLQPQVNIAHHVPSPLPTTAHSIIVSNLGARLDDQSYQNRINPWLFDKLIASHAELALLATILSAMDAEPDVASLLDVLKLWDHDGAGVEPPQRPEKLDEATLNRLRHATWKIVGEGFDRALISSLFGLSLWGEEAYEKREEAVYLLDI